MFLLNNKYLIIGIVFASLIAYHKYIVFSYEHDIENKNITIEKLNNNIEQQKINKKKLMITNINNSKTIDSIKSDVSNLKENNKIILTQKNNEILRLKKLMSSLRVKIKYPEQIKFGECVLDIKTKENLNEDFTYTSISNIGIVNK